MMTDRNGGGSGDEEVAVKIYWRGVHFEQRDWWVGLYWNRSGYTDAGMWYDIYICLVPCLPIQLALVRGWP